MPSATGDSAHHEGERAQGRSARRAARRASATSATSPAGTGSVAGADQVTAGNGAGDAIISIRGLTKSFGSHTVLRDITFDVPRGQISAVMGPSGTGKSVLLKHVIGLLRPDDGAILIDDEDIVGMRERRLMEVRRKLGVLFQDGALFGSMDLFDNIAFPLREHTRKPEKEVREITLEKASLVGLLDHLKKRPGEVSGGMRKRAGLARALALDPEIVLFDEPDSGLDPVRVSYLDELVRKTQEETGATFVIITHNIESALRTTDNIGVLYRSRLVRFAPTAEMASSDDPIIRQFLSGRAAGPIGMDELAEDRTDVERELIEREAARLARRPEGDRAAAGNGAATGAATAVGGSA